MRRVIVAGGTGFFGRAMLRMLAARGIPALAASRRANADLPLDVESAASLRRVLRSGDVVIDTAGPFQDRTTTLVEAALEIGCDVIDISDSLSHAQRLDALRDPIAAAGVRVLPSCSSVSAVTAMLVALSGVESPACVSGFLVPSSRYSASAGTSRSLLRSIGRPIRVWREGQMRETQGWGPVRSVCFPEPFGALRGQLFESADSFWLPRRWPSLLTAELYVDTRIAGLNRLLSLAARSSLVRAMIERFQSAGHRFARRLGPREGGLGVEIHSGDGRVVQAAIYCPDHGYRLAVLPAVLAAAAMVENRFPSAGLIPPDRQIDAEVFAQAMTAEGFVTQRSAPLQ